MTDILDKIDASLEEVEEQLLAEFDRIRETPSDERYVDLDTGIRNALQEVVDQLHDELEHSGDVAHLSLLTERHEVLYARMAVLRQLMQSKKVTRAYLEQAHDGVRARRRSLEERVMQRRRQEDPSVTRQGEESKQGLFGTLKGIFDRKPSDHQLARNTIKVTDDEEKAHGKSHVFLDKGIYSASRELAMLASLVRGGTLDRPPESDISRSRGKAVFEARELSRTIPPVTPKRQQPEPVPEETKEPEISKRDIAQTPEEIRRKLEARRGHTAAGKASFVAKDIDPQFPQDTPRRKDDASGKDEQEDAPHPAGKAIFTAKDIEPAAPQEFRARRARKDEDVEHTDKDDEDERKGPARFESRDLSSTPFPKKD